MRAIGRSLKLQSARCIAHTGTAAEPSIGNYRVAFPTVKVATHPAGQKKNSSCVDLN
jgi:hypothetical protein